MDLVEYTKDIILAIVENKDAVAVKEFPSEEDKFMTIQVIVSESDMPKIIGKNGRIINAIRTLVQASSYLKENKIIKINIDSI